MTVALVLPPLTQLNTPYPSTAYLVRHLRRLGVECTQRDLGIETILGLFSSEGLARVFERVETLDAMPEPAWRALSMRAVHLAVVDSVVAFLQGRDPSLATRILETPFLPAGPRLESADLEAFGPMGAHDAARHLATLYIDDLADLVTACIDPGFAMARYQAHLATGAVEFDPLWERLHETTLVDDIVDALADELLAQHCPRAVGLSVPFPGNFYSALRLGRRFRAAGVEVWLGGGYANTELREIDEPRIWECVDAITYDDGEAPLAALVDRLHGGGASLVRTRTKDGFADTSASTFTEVAADYSGLDLSSYLQVVDTLNPAHRLWADGRWNKITVAHGCYWKRCTFCDVSLDYIGRYEQADVERLVDEMERLIADTGQRGFHFVDEAAPPAALKAVALEILARGLTVSLWGNIRFERAFTPDLCRLLASAGFVALTGGLEVANERLLELIDKGVTVEQVARAAAAMRDAGILVHAYLMYGFPTQTEQETIDSMELVRQLFSLGVINSGFWHRFVLTRHAPIYAAPERYGVEIDHAAADAAFARNDVPHADPSGCDHDLFDDVLPAALEAWQQGRDLDVPVTAWFDREVPEPSEPGNRIAAAIEAEEPIEVGRVVWLGGEPIQSEAGLALHTSDGECELAGDSDEIEWLAQVLLAAMPAGDPVSMADVRSGYPGRWSEFGERWTLLRELGVVIV